MDDKALNDIIIDIESDICNFDFNYTAIKNRYPIITLSSFYEEFGIHTYKYDYEWPKLNLENIVNYIGVPDESGGKYMIDRFTDEVYSRIEDFQEIALISRNKEIIILPFFKDYETDKIMGFDTIEDILRDVVSNSTRRCELDYAEYPNFIKYLKESISINQKIVDSFCEKSLSDNSIKNHFDNWIDNKINNWTENQMNDRDKELEPKSQIFIKNFGINKNKFNIDVSR